MSAKTRKKGKKVGSCVLAVWILLSLSAIPVFATETETTSTPGSSDGTPGVTRYEFEDAEIVDEDGKAIEDATNKIKQEEVDTECSGGYFSGSTGGKNYIYKNVPQFNRIEVTYSVPASDRTLVLSVLEGENYKEIDTIFFMDTGDWYNWDVEYLDGFVVPEGSTIMLSVVSGDVNLDCLDLSFVEATPSPEPTETPIKTVTPTPEKVSTPTAKPTATAGAGEQEKDGMSPIVWVAIGLGVVVVIGVVVVLVMKKKK